MDLGLKGKSVVITGASRGIGYAMAEAFAKEGAKISICGRSEESLKNAQLRLSETLSEVHAFQCDVGNPDEVERYINDSAAALGGIDVLVNNPSGFGELDDEEGWQKSIDVDLLGLVRSTRHALPHLEANGGGNIIHISSISGLMASPESPPYGAIKAAVVHYTLSQASAFAAKNIRVNAVAPGSIYFKDGVWDEVKRDDPDLFNAVEADIPFGRMGKPEEIATATVFLASDAAGWITGQTLAVDGGQMLPNFP